MFQLVLLLSVFIQTTTSTTYSTPPPTFEAKANTKWVERCKESRRANIHVSFDTNDYIDMFRLDLVGKSSYDRGYCHGFLLAKEIVEFTGPKLNQFYRDEVLNLDISQFPEPLQDILKVLKIKGAKAAPEVFKEAMAWVWQKEESFSPQYLKDEIDGMAAGVCAKLPFISESKCNTTEWSLTLKQVNMLPELIRMACTAYGAWGKATGNKGLVQLRALDFGSGPWANFTVIQVHRGPDMKSPFVSVSFPGFVGVITGVSMTGIGISEKVWMTYDTPDLLPGSYNGQSDIFVLRDILQNSGSKKEAEEFVRNVNRTWAIWIGIGDHVTQEFDLVGYQQSSVEVYTDVTAPTMTGQPYLESVAYVDKHPQPSGEGPTGTLPTALTDFYGQISQETSKTIIQYHQTGDVHIASYDFTAGQMYVAIGKIDKDGSYGSNDSGCAYNRPYLNFVLSDLWNGV